MFIDHFLEFHFSAELAVRDMLRDIAEQRGVAADGCGVLKAVDYLDDGLCASQRLVTLCIDFSARKKPLELA
jgi:hypothetical protein